MDRFLISTNPDKVIPPGVVPKDYDREDLIKLMVGYGVEPVKIEGDEQAVWVHFLPDEAEAFENTYYSNKQMLITVGMIAHANEFWRNLMVTWKSKKRHIENLRRSNAAQVNAV